MGRKTNTCLRAAAKQQLQGPEAKLRACSRLGLFPHTSAPAQVVPQPAGRPPGNLLLWRVVKCLPSRGGQAQGAAGRAAQAAAGSDWGRAQEAPVNTFSTGRS